LPDVLFKVMRARLCAQDAAQQALVLPGQQPPARFLHVRLHSLPFGPENNAIHPSISAVGSLHINRLVSTDGCNCPVLLPACSWATCI